MEDNDIKIVEKLDSATLNYLKQGGKVLLSLGKGKVAPDMGGQVGVGFQAYSGIRHGQTTRSLIHWEFYAILLILHLNIFPQNTIPTGSGGMP
jgi:hypothetical protein